MRSARASALIQRSTTSPSGRTGSTGVSAAAGGGVSAAAAAGGVAISAISATSATSAISASASGAGGSGSTRGGICTTANHGASCVISVGTVVGDARGRADAGRRGRARLPVLRSRPQPARAGAPSAVVVSASCAVRNSLAARNGSAVGFTPSSINSSQMRAIVSSASGSDRSRLSVGP